MDSRNLLQTFLAVVGISFLTNLAWENAQAPFYQGYTTFWQHFPICFQAALGDVPIVMMLYFLIAITKKDMLWIREIGRQEKAILIIAGALVAVLIEKWALGNGRWQYASAMLLIPFLNIGLWPVIQMMFLPLLTFYFTKKIYVTR